MSVRSLIDKYGVSASTTRPTQTADAGGAITNSYATSIASLTAYIQRGSPTEGILNGARRSITPTVAYIHPGQDVLAKDRMTYGSETWEILGVRTPDDRASTDHLAYTILALSLVGGEP